MENKLNRSENRIRIALVNFVIVALAGVALRYKITFPFPLFDFKNLLHAHSHFAFAGWASACLFAVLMRFLLNAEQRQNKIYRRLFLLNQFFSYGMLFSFLFEEYGPVSIGFSTGYIFVTYAFAFFFWRDTKAEKKKLSVISLRAALLFLVISSLGPYALGIFKAINLLSGGIYHNSIYWYLHFQYNGWLSFAVFALFLRTRENRSDASAAIYRKPFLLLLIACVPVYLLSVLWVMPPLWVYLIAGLSGAVQVAALIMIVRNLIAERKSEIEKKRGAAETLLLFSLIAFSVKLLLQFLSVFPVFNQFVFGHRPVIIGYLHLVLLGFVSFYLIALALKNRIYVTNRKPAGAGLWLFVFGVLANETGLMLQGFSGILEMPMRWTPVFLFGAGICMFAGLALFASGQEFRQRKKG